ncbi:TonB-dependent receptor [candidate division KSB1 bacterium]|nr:TonB-dependent receptor [candidate division KSB1 bacterium]
MTYRTWLRTILTIVIAHTLCSHIGFAGITGKIAGRLIDAQTEQPLPGGNIMITGLVRNNEDIQFSSEQYRGAATDANGEYYIINLPPGFYIVEASFMGYEKQIEKNVKVSVDYTTRLNFSLHTQTIDLGESVVVTAQKEMIRKDLTSSAVSVSADELESLPVREVNDVLELQAGVIRDAGGQLHIRGGRSNEITYMIDGVQVIDPLRRSSGLTVDNQAIQELQAITGTFNAEYGQALSGVINIITKQGSDKFRFNFSGYLGDYFSYDNDTYYVMNNPDWAEFSAHLLTNQFSESDAERLLSKYDITSSEVESRKPYLEKTGYLDSFNPLKNTDFQVNLSGPVPFTKKAVTYFVSGRYFYDPGYSYGKRYFMPWGFSTPAMDSIHTFEQADNELVPLAWRESFSTQSKLYFRPKPSLNFSYGFYFNKRFDKDGELTYKYVPDATITHDNASQTHIWALNHTLSPNTFYELKFSYFQKDYKGRLYDDPFDYRYMPTQQADFEQYVYDRRHNENIQVHTNSRDYTYFGNDVDRSVNNVKHVSFKFDMTSQVTKRHLLKWGFDGKHHDLKNEWYRLQFNQSTYRPYIPDPDSSAFYQYYHYNPKEYAGYIQDKIEFKELIINLGIRFDYFDSDGNVLSDPSDPEIYAPARPEHQYKNYDPTKPEDEWGDEYTIAEKEQFWYKKASAKYQISPRFGVSFPITDEGVIHFSYGHFFQNPELRYLYENPKYWVDITRAGVTPLIGNADIEAERTVMYEIGIQQGLWGNVFLHATGFYRDIRDWVGISPPIDTDWGTTYHKYINNDNATVKGVTLTGRVLLSNLSVNIDYTYMIAMGTYSNPTEAYNAVRDDKEPRIQLINLNWDQRHSVNTTLNYQYKGWNGSLIATLASGFPYTPQFASGEGATGAALGELKENSEVRPNTYNLDLRISKPVRLFGIRTTFMLNVFNLLDTRNARQVYADTGRPDFTIDGRNFIDRQRGLDIEISDVGEYYNRPTYYYPPRLIQVGLGVGF